MFPILITCYRVLLCVDNSISSMLNVYLYRVFSLSVFFTIHDFTYCFVLIDFDAFTLLFMLFIHC